MLGYSGISFNHYTLTAMHSYLITITLGRAIRITQRYAACSSLDAMLDTLDALDGGGALVALGLDYNDVGALLADGLKIKCALADA